ncbi:MAG: rhodanese-like domain-containing protein [Clostridium perfringens]|nr:rhodanese-like domain-containing protein [Clostridium perfringens]
MANKRFETIHVDDLDEIIDNIELIDIRESYEYRSGHVKGAKNIPMSELLGEAESYLKKDKEYHIICQGGVRSKIACDKLAQDGFKVVDVAGGTGSYIGILEV